MPLLRDATAGPVRAVGNRVHSQNTGRFSGLRSQLVRSRGVLRVPREVAAHRASLAQSSGHGIFAEILRFSNFAGAGPARVGANTGISALGAYDMAGNVKEWCWNRAGERRAILGGGWNEPRYMYTAEDAQDPLARAPAYGFRCALYPGKCPRRHSPR